MILKNKTPIQNRNRRYLLYFTQPSPYKQILSTLKQQLLIIIYKKSSFPMLIDNKKHNKVGNVLKESIEDRDAFFDKSWETVILELPNKSETIEINIAKPSFWNKTCRELISQDIGLWLQSEGRAPWTKGKPPKFELIPIGQKNFVVKHIEK